MTQLEPGDTPRAPVGTAATDAHFFERLAQDMIDAAELPGRRKTSHLVILPDGLRFDVHRVQAGKPVGRAVRVAVRLRP